MKKDESGYFIDTRNWRLHAVIVLFSLVVICLYSIFGKGFALPEDAISLFVLLIIQLEIFLVIAIRLFRDIKPGNERKIITRIILSRFALFISLCFVIAFVIAIILIIVRSAIHSLDPLSEINLFFSKEFASWIKGTASGLLFGAAVFIFIQWQDALKREQKLREQNLIFQNETLRSQVNPHFLFNNLNTLSSLILSRPADAEKFISRLSSIYRYIIENSTRDKVPLQAEISFISDYFFLYRIRDDDKIRMEIDVPGSSDFFILPVSLQVLVENAIKHNRATREEPLIITVYLEGEYVVVKNNLQRMGSQIKSTGIGLKNLSERVRLITGKILKVEESENFFTVKIPLLP